MLEYRRVTFPLSTITSYVPNNNNSNNRKMIKFQFHVKFRPKDIRSISIAPPIRTDIFSVLANMPAREFPAFDITNKK